MINSQEEQRAAERIGNILDSFDPQEGTRILGHVFSDRQVNQFDPMPGRNTIGILFALMRESIKETNEDKKYFVMKLNMYNKMAQALADYLQELREAMQELHADE